MGSDAPDDLRRMYAALDNPNSFAPFITFLKAGDTICSSYVLDKINDLMEANKGLDIVSGTIIGENDVPAYASKNMDIQGKVFKRTFFDYYDSYRNKFVNDVECSLYFAYICDLLPDSHLHLPETIVKLNAPCQDKGMASVHLFREIIPMMTGDYNEKLYHKYIYQVLCDFYFEFIGSINMGYNDDKVNAVIADALVFYNFFVSMNITDFSELLEVYNANILSHYSTFNDPVTIKIPVLSIMSFLDELELNNSSN